MAYTPSETNIVHKLTLSLDDHDLPPKIKLTQYDRTIPILEIRLRAGSTEYVVPEGVEANVRMEKPDRKHVYDPCLGFSEDRKIVYVAITDQMTAAFGDAEAVIEFIKDNGVLNSARMVLSIARNPLPADAYESADDFKTLTDILKMAQESAKEAKASQDAAKASENAARESQTAAANSQTAAKASQDAAKASENAARESQTAAANSQTAAKASQDAAKASETNAEDWSNLSKSYAVGAGSPSKHPNEAVDNSKYYSEQAKTSASSAAASVEVIEKNQEEIHTVVENIDAILSADENALSAKSSAEDAATSADIAQEAADRAQSISQGALGYYATENALKQDHTTGQNGQWAIVGSTDTIWVWDSDSSSWTDSGNKTDLSQYYTKDQTDAEINELQQDIATSGKAAMADKLTVPRNINGIAFDGTKNIDIGNLHITKLTNTDFQAYVTTTNNVHHGAVDELNVFRFFTTGEHENDPSYYHLPCIDSHIFVWSIDNNTSLIRALALDIHTRDIYTCTKVGVSWQDWVKVYPTRTWTVSVPASLWEDGTEAWAGITAQYKAQVACEGMTADTRLAPPQYANGDLASAQAFAWADSGDGAVVLWSETKPADDFTLTLMEVR